MLTQAASVRSVREGAGFSSRAYPPSPTTRLYDECCEAVAHMHNAHTTANLHRLTIMVADDVLKSYKSIFSLQKSISVFISYLSLVSHFSRLFVTSYGIVPCRYSPFGLHFI